MRNLLLISVILLVIACSDSNNDTSNTTIEQITESTPKITIASSFATEDTLIIVASGITMADIKFDKSEIKLPASKKVTIALKNESDDLSMPHNFVVIQKGKANEVGQNGVSFKENGYINPTDHNVIVHSPLAAANSTVYFSFTTPASGEYEFICSYPGHWGLMKGNFITQ